MLGVLIVGTSIAGSVDAGSRPPGHVPVYPTAGSVYPLPPPLVLPTVGSGWPGPPPPAFAAHFRRFLTLYAQFLQIAEGSNASAEQFAAWLHLFGIADGGWSREDLGVMVLLYQWIERQRWGG